MIRREQHEEWMRRALAVASASPSDVPVGAILLGPDGAELATAGNERELHRRFLDPDARAGARGVARCSTESS